MKKTQWYWLNDWIMDDAFRIDWNFSNLRDWRPIRIGIRIKQNVK